jgi:flavin reductase (DIM6/NTAB) family NADH-FMN oxidoreductase RutF
MTTAIPTRALTDPTRAFISVGCTIFLLLAAVAPAAGQSLRGSGASLDRQNRAARRHDFTYIDTANRIRYFADQGWLVRVRPTRDYALHAVSYPYARPELALFVRRLAGQYRSACGEQLVVTSLTRPTTRQPRNASDRSVHPTGMAVDLRYSPSRRCRGWLEQVLLSLERAGVIEATRERYPAHYHVAVFPREYSAYVDQLIERERADPPVRHVRRRASDRQQPPGQPHLRGAGPRDPEGPLKAMAPEGEPRIAIDTGGLGPRQRYQLLTSLVVPRPIGWISTWSNEKTANLAPFSYFAALSSSPMLVGISIGVRREGLKDTLRNVRRTGAFCVNVVGESLLDAMNATSASVPHGVDEFGLVGLEYRPAHKVQAPYAVASPAVLECVVSKEVELEGGANTLVIGRVLEVLLDPALAPEGEDLFVDPERLRPVGRLGGSAYALPGEVRVLPRPR